MEQLTWISQNWLAIIAAALALGAFLGGLGRLIPDRWGGEWLRRAGTDVTWIAQQLAALRSPAPVDPPRTIPSQPPDHVAPAEEPPPHPYQPPPAALLLLVTALCLPLQACAGSFELARHGGQVERVSLAAAGVPAPPADPKRCQGLDDDHRLWSALAKGGAALTASSGLASLPVDDQGARIGLAAAAVAVGAFTALAVAEADGAATTWARECSGQ